jgi:flagellar basal-body rod modification protein FlgD
MSISATEPTGYTGMFGTSTVTPATTTTPGGAATTSKSADKDMFLQLLVAQMKYQDPMNPTDSSQFLAQSAQFTSLEKMQAVADQTQQLVASQLAFGATGLVGRDVSWTDAEGAAHNGTVSGVVFGADGPMLDVGGTSLALSQVQSVRTVAAGGTGSTTSSAATPASTTGTASTAS